jgi:cell division protein FtsQ
VSTTLPRVPTDVAEEPPSGESTAVARHRALIVVSLVTVLVAAIATWVVAVSPVLGANTIAVRGNDHLTAARVIAAADIDRGTPLVRLDTGAVTRRVEAMRDVADATVRSDYPSSVIITITERTAVGFVVAGKRYVLVDKTGDQFRSLPTRPSGLPQFAIAGGTEARATGRAVAVVAAALTPKLLAKVASIQAFDPTAITLLLHDRRVVRWGSAERSTGKARILPVLLKQPGTTFDLTNPDQVVAR